MTLLFALVCVARSVYARPDDQTIRELKAAHPESFDPSSGGGRNRPAAIPDIFGPGSVLTVGNVYMKVTNYGTIGNPFPQISSDPSGQWPGASGIEYLSFALLAVGGVNPTATNPTEIRRVSYIPEWRPPSLDPEDRIYRAYDGIINGQRFVNDDGDLDPLTGDLKIDEDILDGRDNDGDGKIDEDYAALGQQMFSCLMRDDTPQAINTVGIERHVPLGVECRQLAWAYSVPGFQDFNVVEWTIFNRSGHMLDSMYIGLRVDMDCGPISLSTYFADDFDLPGIPFGEFQLALRPGDPRAQVTINPVTLRTDTLCKRVKIRINGWSVVDDEGDQGRTVGVPSAMIIGHTIDPLGLKAPARVGPRAFRSHVAGTPYSDGGNPTIDQQRYEFLSSTERIHRASSPDDPLGGFIDMEPGEQSGDYQTWASVGPFVQVPDGGSAQLTWAFALQKGSRATLSNYKTDYARYGAGLITAVDLFDKYPILANAFAAQVAYEGIYELPRPGFPVPNCHGCESPLILPKGDAPKLVPESCPGRELVQKLVTDNAYTWFDFDCDFCTGVWDEGSGQGYFHKTWNAESPPPNPNTNAAAQYNYTDNPNRIAPAGDRTIILAWDNLSETTADPKTGMFDFRSYRVWKAANWQRPIGAAGPNDDDWSLLAEFRLFDFAENNKYWIKNAATPDPDDSILVCPKLFIPQRAESLEICLDRGDFWDRQSGAILRPDASVDCVRNKDGDCIVDSALVLDRPDSLAHRTRYPVGRYKYIDREVKNGFVYFYSVTAADSTGQGSTLVELSGRRSAVEADAVVPQSSAGSGKGVWVVPNPYRGYTEISRRSSSWDLIPNASDPTGTHIDFLGLPSGKWTIRIFTISGDLVAELHSDDPTNESIRSFVTDESGTVRPGFNRQQDTPNDGQARWNLISKNGQDIVSGIYVFVVKSPQGEQRGKFVVIR